MLENLKRIQNQISTISEYADLASKIQRRPHTKKTASAMAEILDMIQKRTDHLCRQLEKGIAIEQELDRIDELSKDAPGTEIYVLGSTMIRDIDLKKNLN
jgi:hypothetical protein